MSGRRPTSSFFFFNDTATTEIYTLSLHDALPISSQFRGCRAVDGRHEGRPCGPGTRLDRKSTRLNSSHSQISYAVFCLKKKKKPERTCHRAPSLLPTPLCDRRGYPLLIIARLFFR